MTENDSTNIENEIRFTLRNGLTFEFNNFQDNGEDLSFHEVLYMLNNLHEENQRLHKTIEELDNCQKGQSHRINDLYIENKQLKDLIIHLGYTIKYDGYRHISLEWKE